MLPVPELGVMGAMVLACILPEMEDLMVHHVIQHVLRHIRGIQYRIHGYHPEGLVALAEAVFGHVQRPGEVRIPDVRVEDQVHVHQPFDGIYQVA